MSSKFLTPTKDIVSQLRRATEITEFAMRYGIVLNEDGSVFDRRTRKSFSSLVKWQEEVSGT